MPTTPDLQVHRSRFALLLGWAVLVLALATVFDAALRARGGDRVAIVVGALGVAALAYALGIRPAVIETGSALVVRNLVRTVAVPWESLDGTEIADVVKLRVGTEVVRCHAMPRVGRSTERAVARLQQVAAQLSVGRDGHPPATTVVARDGVAALVGGLVLTAAGLVLGWST